MAKKNQIKKAPQAKSSAIDLDSIADRYFWILIPVIVAVYYLSSKYSTGFYQDDEIGQYINMIQFWSDPSIILGNYPKPGYKIFMVVPSLFGYDAVLLFNSIISGITVYLTFILIRVCKIKYAFFGALLLAMQPLFFDLSFRSYAEIFTSLLIVIFLILFQKEKYFLSGLALGFLFTVRQEIALLIIFFIIVFYKKKQWSAIAAALIFPVLYNVLGYLKTGSLLFVLDEMKSVAGLNYQSQGLFHYFKVYIFITGSVTLTLFLAGFFGFLSDSKNYKDYIKKYYLFYLFFISIFIIQMLTMFNNGPNPGNWRYLLHISPVAAVFATIGLNNLAEDKYRKTSLIIFSVFALIVLAFLSKESDGFKLLEVSDYTKFFFVLIVIALTFMLNKNDKKDYLNKLSALLLIAAFVYLFVSFKPKQPSPEVQTVKQISEYIKTLGLDNKKIFSSHGFIMFYSDDALRKNPDSFKFLKSSTIGESQKGDLIIWDSHYSHRPELGNDMDLDKFDKNPDYKLLNQFTSPDKRFVTYVFEKVN